MHSTDYRDFSTMLDAAATLLQRPTQEPLTAEARAMFFRALSPYTLVAVRAAFDAHVKDGQRGRFFPTPADLIAQIDGAEANDGRPGADEAWAIALRGEDEASTVVWTAEIAEAMGIARPVLQAGDEVGARVAFRDTYNRLVQSARAAQKRAEWSASLGFDVEQRNRAITTAMVAGRLPYQAQQLALPGPTGQTLGSLADMAPTPELRARLRAAVDEMKARPGLPYLPDPELQRTEALKREANLRARAYAASQGMDLDGSPLPECSTIHDGETADTWRAS
jgi:hypothetical protein